MKKFFSPNQLQLDSFKLGQKIILDGFKPNYMIALFRGASTIAIHVHELLKYVYQIPIDHIAIRTSRYTGINEESSVVQVHNLGYLVERLKATDKILLIDDVFDSGLSIKTVLDALQDKLGDNTPTDIRIATVDFKPLRNKTKKIPNYYVNETNEWLVYPHELEGMTMLEIKQNWGDEIYDIILNCLNQVD